MKAAVEERLANLEKEMQELKAKVVNAPREKDWRRTVGTLPDDEISREADRLGREWRKSQHEL